MINLQHTKAIVHVDFQLSTMNKAKFIEVQRVFPSVEIIE